jgi:hypothetical protein
MDNDLVMECRTVIAVAEACWRPLEPSYSWHVLEWLCWKQRCKYPLVRKCDRIINFDAGIA